MSLTENTIYPADRVDLDIFTKYKAAHRIGVSLSDTLTYHPWLDTELWARASVMSDEKIVLDQPDYIALRAGWRQLIGDVQLDIDYQIKRFFDDGDRERRITRRAFSANLLWDFWQPSQRRLELGVHLRRDFDTDINSGMIFLTWHTGNGRAYRDFRPGSVDFLELRKRRLNHTYHSHNNAILY